MALNNTKKNRLPVFFLAAGSQCACFVYAQPPPAPVDVRAPVMGRVVRVRLATAPIVPRGISFFIVLFMAICLVVNLTAVAIRVKRFGFLLAPFPIAPLLLEITQI